MAEWSSVRSSDLRRTIEALRGRPPRFGSTKEEMIDAVRDLIEQRVRSSASAPVDTTLAERLTPGQMPRLLSVLGFSFLADSLPASQQREVVPAALSLFTDDALAGIYTDLYSRPPGPSMVRRHLVNAIVNNPATERRMRREAIRRHTVARTAADLARAAAMSRGEASFVPARDRLTLEHQSHVERRRELLRARRRALNEERMRLEESRARELEGLMTRLGVRDEE